MKKFFWLCLVSMLMVSTLFAQGGSEKTYPTRDVEVIVPAEAGGGTEYDQPQIDFHY